MKQIAIGFVLGVCACLMVWSSSGREVQARPAAAAEDGGVASSNCGCTGDLDGNNVVNVFDLLALLANCGPCAPVPPGCCDTDCECGSNEACCGGQCELVGSFCIDNQQVGACANGTIQCVNDTLTCVSQGPQPEMCNGIDDDCDGLIDNGAACPLGETCCNAQCVNLGTDPSNCGSCNVACGFGEICDNGQCITAQCTNASQCDDGNMCTVDMCINFQCVNSPAPSGMVCDDGDPCTVSDTCDGTGFCIGQPVNCGPNSFCSGGTCACSPGFADCDANPANGCEVALNTSLANCGACGNACPSVQNGTATCVSGICGYTCNSGWGDCDGMSFNGCEVHLQSSLNHCGACGNVCPNRPNATRTCTSGMCGFICNPGWADCNGNSIDGCEVNLTNNPNHCGACGNVCSQSTPNCVNSQCVP